MADTEYITREQLVLAVKEKLGIPLTVSRIEKLAIQGKGPRPAAKYGRRLLYKEEDGLAWARSMLVLTEAA